jgi:hypothetical protein
VVEGAARLIRRIQWHVIQGEVMDSYDENAFRARIDAALRRVRTVLDNTRNPQYPAEVPHRYDDKYLLAEFATRVAIASMLQSLEVIGLGAEQLGPLRTWAKTHAVTLRLVAREDCRFVREDTRKVESPDARVIETRGFLGGQTTRTERMVTTVTEYFWSFEFSYQLVAFQGTAVDQAITVHGRSGRVEIKTTTETTPRPKTVVRPSLDVNLGWLLGHLDGDARAAFTIDRTDPECHTPSRNEPIETALQAFDEIAAWCSSVTGYFQNDLFPVQQEHGLDLGAINDRDVFVPVLPLFDAGGDAGGSKDGVLPVTYAHSFLAEEQRSLAEKCRALSTVFPRDATVITAASACLLVTLLHARQVCRQHADSIAYIEDMLREQLIAAIGKELTPADFTAYMDFHHRKLVKPEFRPLPFSYAIRRPDHDPEGMLSIETSRGSASDAISTTVRRTQARRAMSFALDASTQVTFLGERYLHAWIAHQFSSSSLGMAAPSLQLIARARQFSSFILLVGRIASADSFEPRLGIIVQNKDLVKIPLLLQQIPTPKEFRDAIESLSPEQQRFAKAFRGMQLESTLFGVCVVQIKPQLEKLLKLPPDSLTKEIRMTQELLDLFVEYQIPSDLLSYDGPAEAATEDKLDRVRQYVARMYEMIELSKTREREQEREREAKRLAEMNRSVGPPPTPYGAPGGFGPPPMPRGVMGGPQAMPGMPPSMPVAMPMPGMAAPMPTAMPMPGAPSPSAAPPPAYTAAAPTPPPPVIQTSSVTPDASAATAPPAGGGDGEIVDYTRIPGELDRKFESLDTDDALRATIISATDPWTRTAQKGLLSAPTTSLLSPTDQRSEKNRAFDLLDALSKSGALSIDDASLHVVLAATHCFDRTLLDTVIQGNVNPIEKVERSLMIVGTTVHGRPAAELLADDQRDRFFATTPEMRPAEQLGDGRPSPAGTPQRP